MGGRLRSECLFRACVPLMQQVKLYLDMLEGEASQVNEELDPYTVPLRKPHCIPCYSGPPSCSPLPIQNRWDMRRLSDGQPATG